MTEPVLVHCDCDGWTYRRDPSLTDEQAEYDIKAAMNAHVLMSLMFDKRPKSAHKFRSGPAPSSTIAPGSQS